MRQPQEFPTELKKENPMKGNRTMSIAGSFLLGVAMVTFFTNGARAQTKVQLPKVQMPKKQMPLGQMPAAGFNPYAWMTHLDNVGRQQVNQMYNLCIHNPGACRGLATPESLSNAIQGVQQQSLSNAAHTQQNMQKTWNSISNTNCAITGGVVRWNRDTQQNDCYH
jgi:hypothetical protein